MRVSFLQLPSSFGMLPISFALLAIRTLKLPSSPTDAGSSELKLLPDISSSYRLSRRLVDQGIVPDKLHPESMSFLSFFMLPISFGMLLVKWLDDKTKRSRFSK